MKKLILKQDERIEGVHVPANVELGTIDDAGKITATHRDVTRGHLEARLRYGAVIAVDPEPVKTEAPPSNRIGTSPVEEKPVENKPVEDTTASAEPEPAPEPAPKKKSR